ncbi:MAG TPA: FMN-binding protein [Spirochaetota bacterium]|nr:FMN-binding protein [Spirochaetota bacterium]HPC41094.1 FMN-binding protein [Spirochaetota bacterium]HPL16970.1 FMN-binding protein [Spirochaetota bacterium]HQF08793.1 FMN-binding protein [Spirochaetota bacterium]HQH97412.1 FMN-binding protein [Spirochaetota bacterium]
MMKDIIKPTVILTAIALICVFLLSHVEKLTVPVIAKRAKESREQALALVLPGFTVTGDEKRARVDGSDFTWWEGEKKVEDAIMKEKTVKGFAFLTKSPGYSGDIETMVGVDENGKVTGLTVISQTETPGLGARCVEVASRETLWDRFRGGIPVRDFADEARIPWFQNQFEGLDTKKKIGFMRRGVWNPNMRESLLEKNAISAITGATITSTAVIAGIEAGVARLAKARATQAPAAPGGAR